MTSHEDVAEATRLVASGYRATSNKYRMVSRLDREDWREHMAERHSPWDAEGEGMRWVRLLGPNAANHYRRCYSNDKLEISTGAFRIVKSAGKVDSATEFLPLC